MKRIAIIIFYACNSLPGFAQDESYRGGIADGHALVSQVSAFGNPASFQPYFGGIGDGYAADSSINFTQYASINMFSPYQGNASDGYAADSILAFPQHAYINIFQPYASGAADGWAGSVVFGMIIIPVNIISFSGERAGKENVLYWTTSHEENTAQFELERSPDGGHFTRLGTIPAAENSSTEKQYQYKDTEPMQGYNYYRLKIFDTDRTSRYSNILLKVSGVSSLSVYPNPTTKTLNVHITGIDDNTNVSASIFDATGKYVLGMNVKQVNATFRFDVDRLPAGVYVLKVMWSNETSVWRFLKE